MKIIEKPSDLVCDKILNKIYDKVYENIVFSAHMSIPTRIKDIVWTGVYNSTGGLFILGDQN